MSLYYSSSHLCQIYPPKLKNVKVIERLASWSPGESRPYGCLWKSQQVFKQLVILISLLLYPENIWQNANRICKPEPAFKEIFKVMSLGLIIPNCSQNENWDNVDGLPWCFLIPLKIRFKSACFWLGNMDGTKDTRCLN